MLELFISAIIITSSNLIVWNYILKNNINFKKVRTYVGISFLLISLMLNFIMIEPILKSIVILIVTVLTVKIVYDIDLKECIILAIITQLLYIISEVLVIIAVLIITNIKTNQELVDVFFGTVYANLTISLVVLTVIHIPYIKTIYNKLLKIIQNQKIYNVLLIVFTILTTASLIFNFIFYGDNLILLSYMGLILLIAYIGFILNNIMMRNKYLNMYVKYNNSLETLKAYEEIMDKYKVSNHENKNQLLTIRNMINKKEKTVSEFINKLVKNEYQDDEDLMMETSKIPAGGLRALIYSKLLYMKNNSIDFVIKVDKKIRSIELIELDQSMVLDICKIVGVFLDNAIEETKKIKNGNIGIELYFIDDKLNISISNIFEGSIDLDKIDEIKYTTKGEGHGYGLTLVKEIINKNSKLQNIRVINDNVFVQIIKINL